jgi:hypothetical protein
MTNTIQLSTGSFDQRPHLLLRSPTLGAPPRMTVQALLCGYKAKPDVYWGLQKSAWVSKAITQKRIVTNNNALLLQPQSAQADLVEIDGNSYRARVLGNFSDCVIFDRTI